MHTYPRFQCTVVSIFFQLLPSKDCHFACEPSNIVKCQNGLPYPRLGVYIQSLIDTHDKVALCDIVDGTDVTETWGVESLDLDGTTDVDWAKWKNEAIRAQPDSWNILCLVETTAVDRRKIWEDTVRGKEKRLTFKHPKELFATRFRLRGREEPWLKDRIAV